MYMIICEDEKKKKVEWYPRTKNGFKELAQLVGAIAKPTASGLVEH